MVQVTDLQSLIGTKIRLLRRAKNMTQHELAEKAGLIDSYVGGVERGERNISLKTLEKIMHGLEASPSDLLTLASNDQDESRQELISKFITGTSTLTKEQIESVNRIITEVLNTYNK